MLLCRSGEVVVISAAVLSLAAPTWFIPVFIGTASSYVLLLLRGVWIMTSSEKPSNRETRLKRTPREVWLLDLRSRLEGWIGFNEILVRWRGKLPPRP